MKGMELLLEEALEGILNLGFYYYALTWFGGHFLSFLYFKTPLMGGRCIHGFIDLIFVSGAS